MDSTLVGSCKMPEFTTLDRLMSVESLLAHLQHDFDQLSQVVWRQQSELEVLRLELTKITERLTAETDSAEVRDPLAEMPPHY